MNIKRNLYLFAALGIASSALASETNLGIPEYSVAANTSTTLAAFSVSVQGNKGSGSGALFDADLTQVNGVNAIDLCIASADHVTSGQNANLMSVGLHMGNTLFTLNNTNSGILYHGRGNKEDLSFVGAEVRQDQVTGAQWNFLTALVGALPGLSAYNPAAGDQLLNFGFGRSGKYLYRDTDALGNSTLETADTFTPGLQANGHRFTALGFEYFRGDGAGVAYGTDRDTSTVADGAFNYVSGAYDYNSVRWTFSAANGTGQINSGDSGGAIYFDGGIVGVNTYAEGTVVQKDINGNVTQEQFTYGQRGGGLAFSKGDVAWLESQCQSVPEPSAFVVLGLGALALLVRRRS